MTLARGSSCTAWDVQKLRKQASIVEEFEKKNSSFKSKFTKSSLKTFFGLGGLEIKTINFSELSQKYHPGVDWHDLSGEQQASLIRGALQPRETLLDPQCGYLKYWDIVILCALSFTAIV